MQARKADNAHLIDVSHHQGVVDWPKVAATKVGGQAILGAIIKATEGVTGVDSMMTRNATGALPLALSSGFTIMRIRSGTIRGRRPRHSRPRSNHSRLNCRMCWTLKVKRRRSAELP